MPTASAQRFCDFVAAYLKAQGWTTLGRINREQLGKLYDEFQLQESEVVVPKAGTEIEQRPPKVPNSGSDEAWLHSLRSNVAYTGIDVGREIEKCRLWSGINQKPVTRRRIIAWLNRVERPVSGDTMGGVAARQGWLVSTEPANWRTRFIEQYPEATRYHQMPWAEICRDKEVLKIVQGLK